MLVILPSLRSESSNFSLEREREEKKVRRARIKAPCVWVSENFEKAQKKAFLCPLITEHLAVEDFSFLDGKELVTKTILVRNCIGR